MLATREVTGVIPSPSPNTTLSSTSSTTEQETKIALLQEVEDSIKKFADDLKASLAKANEIKNRMTEMQSVTLEKDFKYYVESVLAEKAKQLLKNSKELEKLDRELKKIENRCSENATTKYRNQLAKAKKERNDDTVLANERKLHDFKQRLIKTLQITAFRYSVAREKEDLTKLFHDDIAKLDSALSYSKIPLDLKGDPTSLVTPEADQAIRKLTLEKIADFYLFTFKCTIRFFQGHFGKFCVQQ